MLGEFVCGLRFIFQPTCVSKKSCKHAYRHFGLGVTAVVSALLAFTASYTMYFDSNDVTKTNAFVWWAVITAVYIAIIGFLVPYILYVIARVMSKGTSHSFGGTRFMFASALIPLAIFVFVTGLCYPKMESAAYDAGTFVLSAHFIASIWGVVVLSMGFACHMNVLKAIILAFIGVVSLTSISAFVIKALDGKGDFVVFMQTQIAAESKDEITEKVSIISSAAE